MEFLCGLRAAICVLRLAAYFAAGRSTASVLHRPQHRPQHRGPQHRPQHADYSAQAA